LIWDLRDGWGGAVPEYLDLFNVRAPTMQVFGRDRTGEFENVKWRKPGAMLVNDGTRSGKEVLAYGFKKYRLGEVIGTRTEGAVTSCNRVSDRQRTVAVGGWGCVGRRRSVGGRGCRAND
jgi:C-terminal processing protease CtpA/Prc